MAPAKVQNNDKQAAKPKSGAKCLRNVRPGAQASLSTTSKGAFLHRQQGPCISTALWTQCGFPARVPDVSM